MVKGEGKGGRVVGSIPVANKKKLTFADKKKKKILPNWLSSETQLLQGDSYPSQRVP